LLASTWARVDLPEAAALLQLEARQPELLLRLAIKRPLRGQAIKVGIMKH
jgi:hypothetical protein